MKSASPPITPELRLSALLSLPEFLPIRSRLLIDDFFCLSLHGDVPLSALSDTWNIPCRYETYPGTDHGTGLADGTAAQGWLERAVSFWLEQIVR